MTSNATYSRTITVDLPDFASKAVSFSLLTTVAIDAANNEVFPRKEYSLTLDGSGTGSIALPCPDNTGDAAWAWRVSLPDGRDVTTTLAYAGTSLDLSDWLTAEATTETASTIQALVSGKADKVTGATADNLASLDANGNLQDSGYGVIDEDSMATDSATDVPTQQSVKAYVDAQIGTVDDVTELTTTTGASTNMLRVAAAGGLEYRTTAQVLSDIGAETAGAAATVQGNLDSHTGNTSNPHSVTAAQVGAYTSGETDTAIDTDIGTHAALTSSVHGISVFGATLVDDADAATARGTLGLGSAAVEDASAFDAAGSAASAQAASQPVDADLTAIAGLDNSDSNFIVGSATGWVAESGATVRASLGLGSAAVEDASAFDAAGSAASAQAASQPVDADLTAIAGLSSADGNFIVGSATGWVAESGATALASIGAAAASHTHGAGDITSGTLVHERGGLEADVSAYSGLVKISGGATSAVTVTAFGESLIDDADAATARTTLGLGTMATEATGSFLAATGATTGATSQAQSFGANGIKAEKIEAATSYIATSSIWRHGHSSRADYWSMWVQDGAALGNDLTFRPSSTTSTLLFQKSTGDSILYFDANRNGLGVNKRPSSNYGLDSVGSVRAEALATTIPTLTAKLITAQTANLFEFQDTSSTVLSKFDVNADLCLRVYTDGTRPSAGTAGRVIFNSDDGNLNIDTGAGWILPDGSAT